MHSKIPSVCCWDESFTDITHFAICYANDNILPSLSQYFYYGNSSSSYTLQWHAGKFFFKAFVLVE